MNFRIIHEKNIIDKYPFYSNHYFNCIYNYNNKYAIIEFNQRFQSSIILKTKYYDSLEKCLSNYDSKSDILFNKIIIYK